MLLYFNIMSTLFNKHNNLIRIKPKGKKIKTTRSVVYNNTTKYNKNDDDILDITKIIKLINLSNSNNCIKTTNKTKKLNKGCLKGNDDTLIT